MTTELPSELAGVLTGIDIVADGYVTKAEPPLATHEGVQDGNRTVQRKHGSGDPEHL